MRKRIAVMHDLPSFGGAALMNTIPIMYNMGIEVNPIPTALFTSHGGFKGVKNIGNDAFLDEYLDQWDKLKLSFNGIYLGLFTSLNQVIFAKKFLNRFKAEDNIVLLDPIMGDNGKPYSFISDESIENIKSLLPYADIITPNLTEAYLLLGREYNENPKDSEVLDILSKLSLIGPKKIVLTSVLKGERISTFLYDSSSESIKEYCRDTLDGYYPGTGDAFASVLIGSMLQGKDLETSVCKAINLVEKAINILNDEGLNPMEGLPLANADLIRELI
ncbi:pyridoxamine kinase [Clostridium manihotivorum]|uniref:pyridoxal kinase n=1 Tax=Clostridium manihotivorum TaxID=2320868 RepID=A0A410DMQ0_9CLOT|nr:pyridoxamine kinase [Clostridium manihotivorum]QAA30336.1 pyridoxamine kinase [Clostridium manihotivorum]